MLKDLLASRFVFVGIVMLIVSGILIAYTPTYEEQTQAIMDDAIKVCAFSNPNFETRVDRLDLGDAMLLNCMVRRDGNWELAVFSDNWYRN